MAKKWIKFVRHLNSYRRLSSSAGDISDIVNRHIPRKGFDEILQLKQNKPL